MVFGALVAGGVGSRMNSPTPKQFLMLGKKPILIHTLEKFVAADGIDAVYVGVHPDWLEYTERLADEYFQASRGRIRIVGGGDDRNATVFNIIGAIESDFGSRAEDIIITHDAVRPFVSERMISENIEAAKKYEAVNTAVATVDTIAVSRSGEFIDSMPDRSTIYLTQTPQSFNIAALKTLYYSLDDGQRAALTDACGIFVVNRRPVYIVKGDVSNIKVTTRSDFKIAEAMMNIG